jgi:hypothetical protein
MGATGSRLACCGLLARRLAGRWIPRLRAIGSPLLQAPGYRLLFILIIAGTMLIAMVPEAAFVLPALDVIGLDLVTILVALEMRHYLACAAGVVRMPTRFAVYRHAPALCLYDCMRPVIWIRMLKGTIPTSAPSRPTAV